MENYKNLSISLLNELLKNFNNSRLYAETKLKYLEPNSANPNCNKQVNEFIIMRDQSAYNVTRVSNCITWLSSLETDTNH